jgi:hypothetical protein
MVIDGLGLPAGLVSLVEARIWPRTAADVRTQRLQPRVPKERVRLVSADDTRLELLAYEHLCLLEKTIQDYTDHYRRENIEPELDFWRTRGDLENIDPRLAIAIGHFGLGSDSYIVLDYRGHLERPTLLRLAWDTDGIERSPERDIVYHHRTRWVPCAPTFEDFVKVTGLDTAPSLVPLE